MVAKFLILTSVLLVLIYGLPIDRRAICPNDPEKQQEKVEIRALEGKQYNQFTCKTNMVFY